MTPPASVPNSLFLPLFFTLPDPLASRFGCFDPLPGLFPPVLGGGSLGGPRGTCCGSRARLCCPTLGARPAVTVTGPSTDSFSVLIVAGNGPWELDGPVPAPIPATGVHGGPVSSTDGAALCPCHAAEVDEDPDQTAGSWTGVAACSRDPTAGEQLRTHARMFPVYLGRAVRPEPVTRSAPLTCSTDPGG